MGLSVRTCSFCNFFFFNDTATTEIYTLSLHDALPICSIVIGMAMCVRRRCWTGRSALLFPQDALAPLCLVGPTSGDRKSTRLNSSHVRISYAVFCLKKKKPYLYHALQPRLRTCLVFPA